MNLDKQADNLIQAATAYAREAELRGAASPKELEIKLVAAFITGFARSVHAMQKYDGNITAGELEQVASKVASKLDLFSESSSKQETP